MANHGNRGKKVNVADRERKKGFASGCEIAASFVPYLIHNEIFVRNCEHAKSNKTSNCDLILDVGRIARHAMAGKLYKYVNIHNMIPEI